MHIIIAMRNSQVQDLRWKSSASILEVLRENREANEKLHALLIALAEHGQWDNPFERVEFPGYPGENASSLAQQICDHFGVSYAKEPD